MSRYFTINKGHSCDEQSLKTWNLIRDLIIQTEVLRFENLSFCKKKHFLLNYPK